MANNLGMILAGKAYVEYSAGTEKFRKETQQNEQRFGDSQEWMWREKVKAHAKWAHDEHRFRHDRDRDERRYQEQRDSRNRSQKDREANRETQALERSVREFELAESRKERATKQRVARAKAQYEQDLRTVAVGGTYLGREAYRAGSFGLSKVMESVQQYGSIESFMNTIRGSVKDNTNDIIADMQRLEAQAYKLGESTEYDAAHVASAMDRYAVGNASPADILKSMRSTVDVASVYSNSMHGKVMPDQAARTLQEIMNAQGKTFDWVPDLADKLSVAARQADLSLTNIGDALRYAGGTASEAGVNFDELLATLVVLDRRGQKGEMGGTAIRGIMASLLDPTDDALVEYEKFGIQIPDKGKLSLIDLIRQFETKLAGLDEIQRAAVISKAFPNRQMTGVQMLVGASGQIREQMGLYQNSQGKSAEIAATKRQGVEYALDVVNSALQTFKAAFGKTLVEDVKWVAKTLAEALSWLSETLKSHPEIGTGLGRLAVGLLALGTAIGALAQVGAAVVGIKAIHLALTRLLAVGATSAVVGGAGAGGTGLVGSILASISGAFAAALASPAVIGALAAGLVLVLDHFFNDGKLTNAIGHAVMDNPVGDKVIDLLKANDVIAGMTKAEIAAFQADKRLNRDMGPLVERTIALDPATGLPLVDQGGHRTAKQMIAEKAAKKAQDAERRLAVKASLAEYEAQTAQFVARSRNNPENAAAWEAWQKQNAPVAGFEDHDDHWVDPKNKALGRKVDNPALWHEFLREFRRDSATTDPTKAKGATARNALANLGDFEVRSTSGMNLVLDLLRPKRDAEGNELAAKGHKAMVKSEEHLAKIAKGLGKGHVIGGKSKGGG